MTTQTFLVIGAYPESPFTEGQLIEMKAIFPFSGLSYEMPNGEIVAPPYFSSYPHLFKDVTSDFEKTRLAQEHTQSLKGTRYPHH